MTAGIEPLTLTLGGRQAPAVRITGSRPGPHLTLLAGVHGCEYSSIAGLRAFIATVDPRCVSGTVLAVPIVNLSSFLGRTPFVVPEDGKNLNRCFPGSPHGTAAERLAYDVTEQLIAGSDAVVDMHAGDQVEALEPFVLYDSGPAQAQARAMAAAYGVGYVISQQGGADGAVTGSTSRAAAAMGIPAIIAEAGGCGLVTEDAVEAHRRGVCGVMESLGMLPASRPRPAPVELDSFLWLRCSRPGWWAPVVDVGDPVSAGDLLGIVSSLDGSAELERILAPVPGVPMFITTSPAVQADGLLLGLGASSLPGAP